MSKKISVSGRPDVYRQLSRIKRGYFGTVYKVKKRGEKPIYALKKIKLSQDTALSAQREINSHLFLPAHPCVVSLLDHFIADSVLNIVMEYCDVGTLNSYLWIYIPNKDTLLSFVKDMAQGLDHLHQNGIVHGDIKPDNILLCSSGNTPYPRCKLADFGLARFSCNFNPLDGVYLTGNQGSLFFMAPEVASQTQLTKRSDIFSLGVVFYSMYAREFYRGMLSPTVNGRILFWQAPDKEKTLRIESSIESTRTAGMICNMVTASPNSRLPASEVLSALTETSVQGIMWLLLLVICIILMRG